METARILCLVFVFFTLDAVRSLVSMARLFMHGPVKKI